MSLEILRLIKARFVVAGTPATLPTFENALFGPFTIIIQQEIERL